MGVYMIRKWEIYSNVECPLRNYKEIRVNLCKACKYHSGIVGSYVNCLYFDREDKEE